MLGSNMCIQNELAAAFLARRPEAVRSVGGALSGLGLTGSSLVRPPPRYGPWLFLARLPEQQPSAAASLGAPQGTVGVPLGSQYWQQLAWRAVRGRSAALLSAPPGSRLASSLVDSLRAFG